MAEEYEDTNVEQEESEDVEDIWSMLKLDDPGPSPYDDAQEDADEQIAKEDKMVKKLSAKMDNMQKKFEATMLKERISHFEKDATDLEKGLFKTVAADVRDMESLDKAMELVRTRAQQMQTEAEKYRQQLEEQARGQVKQAWGTAPIGTPTPRSKDEEEELMKKVEKGDLRAAFTAVVGDDIPFSQ